jgi:cytochrome c peroxidase
MEPARVRGATRSRRAALTLAALASYAAGGMLSPAFADEPPPAAGQAPAAQAAPAAAAQPTSPTHGALAMDAQLALLPKLGLSTAEATAPTGIDSVVWAQAVPDDNEPTPERIALGQKLFFDPRLSADGTVACATCHDVSRGFTDQRAVSEGIGGKLGRRNAPTTMNALLFITQFWDGRAQHLEDQAKLPILNPVEMGQPNGDAVIQKIAPDSDYQAQFQKAYGRAVNYDDLGRAIAAFERTLVFLDSPFDRFMAGDANAMSADAQKGFALFNGKARCVSCHQLNPANPIGTDNRFHNIGVSARHQDFQGLAMKATAALEADPSAKKLDELALETDLSELGRFMVTRRREDIGAFKTSQVRNLAVTAPYMHDGSMQTLWDVMDHYNRGGEANLFLDGGITPLALSEQEIDQLVAFMFALTDVRFAKETETAMASQRTRANTQRPFRDEALALRKELPFQKAVQGKAAATPN